MLFDIAHNRTNNLAKKPAKGGTPAKENKTTVTTPAKAVLVLLKPCNCVINFSLESLRVELRPEPKFTEELLEQMKN